jgi:translocation and assembly module TamA
MPAAGSWWRRAAALAWLLWCAAAPAHAQEEVAAPIEIDAPAPLREMLRQYVSVLRATDGLNDEGERLRVTRLARRQTEELLATEGYFTPKIDIAPGNGGASEPLKIAVDPGPRSRVDSLDLEFQGDIARAGEERAARVRRLRESWLLKPGEPFRQQAWDQAKQAVLRQLLAQDYAAATLTESRAEVDPKQATVRLRVVFDSGPPFALGKLEVSGLENYGADLVERYNTLNPGEPYSQERLLQFQTALQNTPYFSSAVVDVDRDPAHAGAAPVLVQVRESKPKRLGLGGGYSSNTGARVELSFRNADLGNRAWNLASGLRIEQKRQFGYADVYLPPTGTDYRDSFGVLAERTDIQGLTTRRAAAGVVRSRTRGNIETRLSLNLQRETEDTGTEPTKTTIALVPNWSWTYRNVDNLLDPRRGYVINLQVGGAAKALLSDQNFVRLYGRHQHFLPVGERDVVILRAELGYTAAPARDGIPQEYLFRAGGSQSVRGYAYQSLGVTQDGAVVGGRKLAVASAEYVHWFDREWGAALFYDAGNAWDVSEQARLFVGYGAGARWRSPAGPLAVDVGYGERDQKFRLHFSLAIAF